MRDDNSANREITRILAGYGRRDYSRAQALRLFAGLGVAATVPWVAGCGDNDKESAGSKPSQPTGTLEFLSAENLLGRWDPTAHTNLAHLKLEANVFDYLIQPDENKQLKGMLAESWNQLDPKTIEFKLRQGVKFHDGGEFTAKDVKATIEYASRADALSNNWFPLKRPVNVEVVDDYTCRLKSEFPAGGLLYALGMIPVLSSQDVAKPAVLNERMNGTGPFKWEDYKGESGGVVMSANTDYWQGTPLIKEYIFRYVGESSTRLAALQSGEVNAIDRVEPDQIKVLESSGNTQVDQQTVIEQKWFQFETSKPPFKGNKLLRQALCHAIDKQGIVDQILLGSGKVSDSHLSPGQFAYAPAPNNIQFDPDKAKKLLAEAGFPNGNGLGKINYVTSVGFYPKTKEYGQIIAEQMRDIGIDFELSTQEVAAWNECLYSEVVPRCGHVIDSGWLPTTLEPDAVIVAHFYKGGVVNHVNDPELNKALEAETFEPDLDKRAEVMKEVTIPKLMDYVAGYPLFVSELAIGTSKNVKGLDQLAQGYFFLHNPAVNREVYISQ